MPILTLITNSLPTPKIYILSFKKLQVKYILIKNLILILRHENFKGFNINNFQCNIFY